MQHVIKSAITLGVIAVLSGCASQVGGTKDPYATRAVNAADNCESGRTTRVYRNAFLHARRVGTASCVQ